MAAGPRVSSLKAPWASRPRASKPRASKPRNCYCQPCREAPHRLFVQVRGKRLEGNENSLYYRHRKDSSALRVQQAIITLGKVMYYFLKYLLYLTLEYFPECIVFGIHHSDRFLPADAACGIRLLLFVLKLNCKLDNVDHYINGQGGIFRASLATLITVLYTFIALYSPRPFYSPRIVTFTK